MRVSVGLHRNKEHPSYQNVAHSPGDESTTLGGGAQSRHWKEGEGGLEGEEDDDGGEEEDDDDDASVFSDAEESHHKTLFSSRSPDKQSPVKPLPTNLLSPLHILSAEAAEANADLSVPCSEQITAYPARVPASPGQGGGKDGGGEEASTHYRQWRAIRTTWVHNDAPSFKTTQYDAESVAEQVLVPATDMGV